MGDTDREAALQKAESVTGVRNRRAFSHLPGQQLLEFDQSKSVPDMVQKLSETGLYEFVEADHIRRARLDPNEANYTSGLLWSLHNTGNNGTAGADISAAAGWTIQSTAPKVIVAVIDSGARLTHEDLAGNLWTNPSPGTSGYTNDLHGINVVAGSGNPSDDAGHGSHVSGIIGAVGNNSLGIVGVAWQVQLMELKFLDSAGSGSSADSVTCINYAIAHGASVINASYGDSSQSSSELAAIQSAAKAGIIFVAASGNDSANSDTVQDYPANYPVDNIVSVASSDWFDHLSSFSNYGSGLVEIAAPGEQIYSTYNGSDHDYATLSGTSMAAPQVTGAFALLKAHFPNDTYRQLINRLLSSVDQKSAFIGKVQSGGRLNLAKALSSTSSAPFNDNFANRAQLSGSFVTVRSSNQYSTKESGEPAHAGVAGGSSLWWTWSPPTSGLVSFDTKGSAYDTVLAIYTGNSLGNLQLVTSNDDSPNGGTTSRATATLSAGTTYQIAVDGKNGASGLTMLQIGIVPANDAFASAQVVTGQSFGLTANNINASSEPGEPNHAGAAGGHSLWYQWVAPTSGQYQLAVYSADTDMLGAVYTGTALSNLQLIASNDDSTVTNSDALVTFTAVQGTTYYFAVDNSNKSGGLPGNFTLTLADSLWQFPVNANDITSSPAVGSDGTVYFGGTDNYFYAVNPNGTLKWRYYVGSKIALASPAIAGDGTIYVGANNGNLYALSSSGKLKWTVSTIGSILTTPAIGADGSVYLHGGDGNLYSISSTGATNWTYNLGETSSSASYSSPAVGTDGTIYIGSADSNLYVFTSGASSATLKWKFNAKGQIYTSPAIGSDGTIYIGTLGGDFYALSPAGSQKWSQSFGTSGAISSSPALAGDGSIYFGQYDGNVCALKSDGTVKWKYLTGVGIRASSPAVGADGAVYIGSYDDNIYAINADGSLRRTYATAGQLRSSPVLSGGRLYICSQDAKLYALLVGQNAAASSWPMFHQNALHTGLLVSSPVTLAQADPNGRLLNISTRGTAGNDAQALIAGFTVTGGPRTLLVRAVGPTLASYGVSGTIKKARLQLYTAGASTPFLDQSQGWTVDNDATTAASIAAKAQSVGDFALPSGSGDAAVLVTLNPGSYTAKITPADGVPGIALVEVYDTGPLSSTARVTSLSSRLTAGATDSRTATAGFSITGGCGSRPVRSTGHTGEPAVASVEGGWNVCRRE